MNVRSTEVTQEIVVSDLSGRVTNFLQRGIRFHEAAEVIVLNFLSVTNGTFSQRMCDDCIGLWMCILKEGQNGMHEITYGDNATNSLCRLQRTGENKYTKYYSKNNSLWKASVDPELLTVNDDSVLVQEQYFLNERRWFQEGMIRNDEPFLMNYEAEPDLPVISSQLVISPTVIGGRTVGVMLASWAPNTISNFLRISKFTELSRTFICDDNGLLFDASNGPSYDEYYNPLKITDLRIDPLIREAAEKFYQEDKKSTIQFNYNNATYFVFSRKFNHFGINLYLGCIVERTLNQKTTESLIFSSLVVLLFTTFSVICSCIISSFCISSPINKFTKDMKDISEFRKLNKRMRTPLLFELRQMSNSVNSLKRGIKNFKLYLPGFVVDVILRDEKKSQLGLTIHRITVVFTEISNFSNISQQMSAENLVIMLNEFFSEVSESVVSHGGWINIFLGDTMFCSFGLEQLKAHEFAAVESSLEMDSRITKLQEIWKLRNYPKVTVHQGINTGQIWVGNIGNSNFRMQWTCLGDAVNTAARIQQIGSSISENSNSILIGEATQSCVGHLVYTIWVGGYQLRGRKEVTNIYKVIAGKEMNGVSPFYNNIMEESLKIKEDYEKKNYMSAIKRCQMLREKYSIVQSIIKPFEKVEMMMKEKLKHKKK